MHSPLHMLSTDGDLRSASTFEDLARKFGAKHGIWRQMTWLPANQRAFVTRLGLRVGPFLTTLTPEMLLLYSGLSVGLAPNLRGRPCKAASPSRGPHCTRRVGLSKSTHRMEPRTHYGRRCGRLSIAYVARARSLLPWRSGLLVPCPSPCVEGPGPCRGPRSVRGRPGTTLNGPQAPVFYQKRGCRPPPPLTAPRTLDP